MGAAGGPGRADGRGEGGRDRARARRLARPWCPRRKRARRRGRRGREHRQPARSGRARRARPEACRSWGRTTARARAWPANTWRGGCAPATRWRSWRACPPPKTRCSAGSDSRTRSRPPGLKMVSSQSGDWEMAKANQVAAAQLTEHPRPQGDPVRQRQHGAGRGGRDQRCRAHGPGARRRLRQHLRGARPRPRRARCWPPWTSTPTSSPCSASNTRSRSWRAGGAGRPRDARGPGDRGDAALESPKRWHPPLLHVHRACEGLRGARAARACPSRSRRGEVHALVGENGAGKSTLCRIVAGPHARRTPAR